MRHEILGVEHLYHRFLEPGAWADVLFSQKITKKGKESSPLKMIPKLKNPDLKFLEHEQANDIFGEHMTSLSSITKKLQKNCMDTAVSFAAADDDWARSQQYDCAGSWLYVGRTRAADAARPAVVVGRFG